ncbi:MAG: SDR family NAD(P)-dependent oxidoreductase [Novosphingobium sp.]
MPQNATLPGSARTVVITGASSGIGKACAEAFARMGWHVIGTGRDPQRCEDAEQDIRAVAAPGARVDFLQGDFTEMAQVKRIAREICSVTDRIHVLVNNAGGVRDDLYRTSEGLEATFATNHLAPFLLTRELLPLLERAAQDHPQGTVRVIAVSSTGHMGCPAMRWDDLMHFGDFSPDAAYCQAKLANLLFIRELDRKLAGSGIIAQAMHPGRVDSNFASHGDETMRAHMAANTCIPPETPARTIVWMATAPELGADGGRYFHDLGEEEPAPQARDDAAAFRLWIESERILAELDPETV